MAEWNRVHYSDNDVLTMQQEAIRRVQQMQDRSRQTVNAFNTQYPNSAPQNNTQAGQSNFGAQPLPAQGAQTHHAAPNFARAPHPAHNGRVDETGGPLSFLSSLGSQITDTIGNLGSRAEGGEKGKGLLSGGLLSGGLSGGLGSIISSVVGEESPAGKALAALGLDHERILLIGLLLILMNEKADFTLLVALFYLLL